MLLVALLIMATNRRQPSCSSLDESLNKLSGLFKGINPIERNKGEEERRDKKKDIQRVKRWGLPFRGHKNRIWWYGPVWSQSSYRRQWFNSNLKAGTAQGFGWETIRWWASLPRATVNVFCSYQVLHWLDYILTHSERCRCICVFKPRFISSVIVFLWLSSWATGNTVKLTHR